VASPRGADEEEIEGRRRPMSGYMVLWKYQLFERTEGGLKTAADDGVLEG